MVQSRRRTSASSILLDEIIERSKIAVKPASQRRLPSHLTDPKIARILADVKGMKYLDNDYTRKFQKEDYEALDRLNLKKDRLMDWSDSE